MIEPIQLFNNLIDESVEFISKEVKHEKNNIRKLLHTCLSAYTTDPQNAVVVASSSEGKTWLVMHVANLFPKEDTIILRSVSPKTFTREHGEYVIRNPDPEAPEEELYIKEIQNPYTHEETCVADYVEFLRSKTAFLKKAKGKDDITEELNSLKKDYRELQGKLYNCVDLRNKILVFLDDIPKEVFSNLQSVLSHDQFWSVVKFVEGEGYKTVKNVVFQGYPAVIFCTSKETVFSWKDLNTRFELMEPCQSTIKYVEAMELSAEHMFGMNVKDIQAEKDLQGKLYAFIGLLKQAQYKTITPFEPKLLAKLIEKPQVGATMRYFKQFMAHIGLETLWHYPERVKLKMQDGEYLLVAAQDLDKIKDLFFGSFDIMATLNGVPVSLIEFYVNILLDMQAQYHKNEFSPSEITTRLANYIENNKDTRLKSNKMAVSRILSSLEKAGFIIRLDNSESKREKLTVLKLQLEDLTRINNSNKNSNTNGNINGNINSNLNTNNSNIDDIFQNLMSFVDIKSYFEKIVTHASKMIYNSEIFESPYDDKVISHILFLSGFVTIPVTINSMTTNTPYDVDVTIQNQPISKTILEYFKSNPSGLNLGPDFEHALNENERPILRSMAQAGEIYQFKPGNWKLVKKVDPR